MKDTIEFRQMIGGKELLEKVRSLWENLNQYHKEHSLHFEDKFQRLTFDIRKDKFEQNPLTKVRIHLIENITENRYVGYSITTISSEGMGEVDSLYIEVEYRKYGLGDQLMKSALDWLNQQGVTSKKIVVAAGNDGVLDFYRRYGFQVSLITLEEAPKKEDSK